MALTEQTKEELIMHDKYLHCWKMISTLVQVLFFLLHRYTVCLKYPIILFKQSMVLKKAYLNSSSGQINTFKLKSDQYFGRADILGQYRHLGTYQYW